MLAALAAALVAGTAGLYLFVQQGDAERLDRAERLGRAGSLAAAVREARHVERSPAAERAALAEAYALLALGRFRSSATAFARAARADPQNWIIHRDHARALLAAGLLEEAGQAMARAQHLNPRMTLPPGFQRVTRRR